MKYKLLVAFALAVLSVPAYIATRQHRVEAANVKPDKSIMVTKEGTMVEDQAPAVTQTNSVDSPTPTPTPASPVDSPPASENAPQENTTAVVAP